MKYQSSFIARNFFVIAFVIGFSIAETAVAITINVDAFIDDNSAAAQIACNSGAAGCTLRAALIIINNGTAGTGPHTIYLDSSSIHQISISNSNENDATDGDLDVNSTSGDITIRSASGTAVIEARTGHTERIFHIFNLSSSATVIFQDIIIQRASGVTTSQIGAGIYYVADGGGGSTATFQLSNVTLDNNSVATTGDGGGIYIDATNDSVSITGSTITEANITGNGGAIYNNAGANGTVSIDGSTISSSTASVNGGGIYNNTNSTISITGSTISSNTSTISGGGIHNVGTATLSSTVVSGNSSNTTGAGGGIYNDTTGTLTLTDSTLSSNTDNGSSAGGGGLYNASNTTINRSTIGPTNHSITDGGGIYNVATATLTAINSTVSGNTTDGDGGGIYVLGGTVDIRNNTIANNTADNDSAGTENGGGIFVNLGTVTLYNSIIANNQTNTGTNPDCSGTVVDGGFNIIEDVTGCTEGGGTTNADPNLAALTNNGGVTNTHALNSGSIAIDAGNPGDPTGTPPLCETEDQTNNTRPLDGDGDSTAICDIGSYEAPAPAAPPSGGDDCYIATAAYGTKMEKDVVTLRRFRDRYLLTNKPGQLFTDLYYKLSPPVASRISTSETLREWARASLIPLVSLGRLLDDAGTRGH